MVSLDETRWLALKRTFRASRLIAASRVRPLILAVSQECCAESTFERWMRVESTQRIHIHSTNESNAVVNITRRVQRDSTSTSRVLNDSDQQAVDACLRKVSLSAGEAFCWRRSSLKMIVDRAREFSLHSNCQF
jgi:hypothetical protein